jgi:hypothetical protein
MSKVLSGVAVVAGLVAVFVPGLQAVGAISLQAGLAGTIGAVAGAVGALASLGAQLTAKKPSARGSVNQTLVVSDPPSPYLMGRTFFGGVMRHEIGYGATIKKVPNPYYGRVVVYSVAGPLAALISLNAEYNPLTISGDAIGGYYSGFLYADTQLGASPEPSALVPHFSGMPNWSAAHKLSGQAAILWNAKFDKGGKVFASGLPSLGAVWNGVKVYDPRKDSSYPGGSGTHRINNESTWAFSANPSLHGIAYIYGRYQNGKKVFGLGSPVDAIDMRSWVAFANVCDANNWTLGGVIFEPGDDGFKWNNLKEICQAGAGEPIISAGGISVKYQAPRISLDTITIDDLWDDDVSLPGTKSYAQRLNGIVPKVRSEAHNWGYTAGSVVSVPAYVTIDGERKEEERQYNLVQNFTQGAQLAMYEIEDGRELSPIQVSVKPRFRRYRVGDCLTLAPMDEGLSALKVVILAKTIDPGTGRVEFTLESETDGKHEFALGATTTPPPGATLQAPGVNDLIAEAIIDPDGLGTSLISLSSVTPGILTATDAGATTSIIIASHDRYYPDKTVIVDGATISGLAFATTYSIYYDDTPRTGGAVSFVATTVPADAFSSSAHPSRHNVGVIITPADGAANTTGFTTLPPGWNYNF